MTQAATGAIVEQVRRFTVGIRRRNEHGGGAGVVWRSDGLIVTNAHVARGAKLTVELPGGRDVRAEIVASDPRRDLAAIKVDASLEAAPIGDSSALRAGELVVAVGNPLGVKGAASLGIVHEPASPDWVRADVQLAPGNSGGPLVNARGEVVGINAMIVNGLGFAVPSRAVTQFLAASTRPRFGVTLQPAGVFGGVGLAVLDVAAGSLADRAGIALGDVLLGVDGRRFTSLTDFTDAMGGSAFSLEYLRAGGRRTITIDPREGRRAA